MNKLEELKGILLGLVAGLSAVASIMLLLLLVMFLYAIAGLVHALELDRSLRLQRRRSHARTLAGLHVVVVDVASCDAVGPASSAMLPRRLASSALLSSLRSAASLRARAWRCAARFRRSLR